VLSTSLVTIECCAFFLALLIISGISDNESYNKEALFNILMGFILFSLCFLVPFTFLLKYDAFSSKFDSIRLYCQSICNTNLNRVSEVVHNMSSNSSASEKLDDEDPNKYEVKSGGSC
jgi:hypothetical protein